MKRYSPLMPVLDDEEAALAINDAVNSMEARRIFQHNRDAQLINQRIRAVVDEEHIAWCQDHGEWLAQQIGTGMHAAPQAYSKEAHIVSRTIASDFLAAAGYYNDARNNRFDTVRFEQSMQRIKQIYNDWHEEQKGRS